MAEWRIGRGWSNRELEERFDRIRKVETNFPLSGPESQTGDNWTRYYTESIIGREVPGPPVPGGEFEIAWKAVGNYQFSDPGIVVGHFNPKDPLKGRSFLLEIKVLLLHYLCGARIGAVRESHEDKETVYGFRYDTLEGHLEVGSEWFLLTKKHDSGEVWFRISASWRPGEFPNWWSRLGFHLLSHRYQLAWHRLAYIRLREIVGAGGLQLPPVPYGERLVHKGPEIADSGIWGLDELSATGRVIQMGKDSPDPKKQ